MKEEYRNEEREDMRGNEGRCDVRRGASVSVDPPVASHSGSIGEGMMDVLLRTQCHLVIAAYNSQ